MSIDGFFDRISRNHPLQTMMNIVIAGITVLFVSMLLLFAFSGPAAHLGGQHFPKLFFASTVIILLSSYTVSRALKSFRAEKAQSWRRWLMLTLVLAAGFSASQYFGWKQLWSSGITLYEVRRDVISRSSENSSSSDLSTYAGNFAAKPEMPAIAETERTPSGAFLYIISGLHLAHLGGGLIFLILSLFKSHRAASDPLRALVIFSNPVDRVRAAMLARYWHYLDILWIVLFLYFLWFFV